MGKAKGKKERKRVATKPSVGIIDGKNLAYRGLPNLGEEAAGRSVGIVTGFVRGLVTILKNFDSISEVVVAWDSGIDPWRRGLFDNYRQRDREADPNAVEVRRQVKYLRSEIVPLLPVRSLAMDDIEADDLIWSSVWFYYHWKKSGKPVIFSTDHDFFQLLDSAHQCKDYSTLLDEEWFLGKYGFRPDLWPSYRAMVGDSSDNIKGVQGIGEVTAGRLMRIFSEKEKSDLRNAETFAKWMEPSSRQIALLRAGHVFKRNLKLIDLHLHPDTYKFLNYATAALEEDPPKFEEESLRRLLFNQAHTSLLRNWEADLGGTFRRLCRS